MGLPVDPSVYANMLKTYQDKDKILSAINGIVDESEHIEEMRFRFSGIKYKRVSGGLLQQVKYHEPLMNELGCQQVTSYYSSFLAKNIILSCYEEKMIKIICEQFDCSLLDELTENIINYGINSGSSLRKIWRMLSVNHEAVLNRSLRGLTLVTALKNINISEIRSLDSDDKKGGLLGRFKLK